MLDINPEKKSKEQLDERTKNIFYHLENYICKIKLKNGEIGIGFFCKIPFKNYLLPVLITNNHILNKDDKDNTQIIINLITNNEERKIEIGYSRKKYISSYNNIYITIIEIKPNEDKIYHYLELDNKSKNKENLKLEYKNKSINIFHYPDEENSEPHCLTNNIIDNTKINHDNNTEDDSSIKEFEIHHDISKIIKLNYDEFIKYILDEFNNSNNKYKNEINLIYKTDKEDSERIFGYTFVENNKNNIELIINGIKNDLISVYKLKEGENNIKIIIKNKITNLKNMFYNCKSLKNIKELEYLDIEDVNNFSGMFYECSSISDIKALQNWNVSNGKDFSYMFYKCSSISDLESLQNWNVSNGNNFKGIFYGCSLLSNIKA